MRSIASRAEHLPGLPILRLLDVLGLGFWVKLVRHEFAGTNCRRLLENLGGNVLAELAITFPLSFVEELLGQSYPGEKKGCSLWYLRTCAGFVPGQRGLDVK